MKNLLIVTYYRYPNGDAGAVRSHTFAKLFQSLGISVVVLGMGHSTDFLLKEYDNVPYISLRHSGQGMFARVKNYLGYKKNLQTFLKNRDFDGFLYIGGPKNGLIFLKKYAKRHGIQLLHDSVEWYSPEQFCLRKWDPSYRLKDNTNRKWIDKQFSVIAISTYLEEHFKSRGIRTTRIPVIMDMDAIPCQKNVSAEKTVFLYAGSPGKKDYLAQIVDGFSCLEEDLLSRVELRLLGVRREQLVDTCGVNLQALEKCGTAINCLGRVSREEVLRNLSQADYTLLLRSAQQRYAQAGFPTKVVESLATATPVVTNLTSDLGLYLRDGENAIIIQGDSKEEVRIAIEKAVAVSADQRTQMQKNARKTAEESFDYRHYLQHMQKLIEK